MLLGVPLVLTLAMSPLAFAEEPQVLSEEKVAERAKEAPASSSKGQARYQSTAVRDQAPADTPASSQPASTKAS